MVGRILARAIWHHRVHTVTSMVSCALCSDRHCVIDYLIMVIVQQNPTPSIAMQPISMPKTLTRNKLLYAPALMFVTLCCSKPACWRAGDIRYRSANRLRQVKAGQAGTATKKRKLEKGEQQGQQQGTAHEQDEQQDLAAGAGGKVARLTGVAADGAVEAGHDVQGDEQGQGQGHNQKPSGQHAAAAAGGDMSSAADDGLLPDMSSEGEDDIEGVEEEEGGDLADAEAAVETMAGQVVDATTLGTRNGKSTTARAAAGAAGGGKRFDVLANGQVQGLCLCAAELRFTHPATGEPFRVEIPEPESFRHAKQVEADAAAAAAAASARVAAAGGACA
jgi:hypothetical protein